MNASVEIEAAASCLVGAAIFFAIGRYIYPPGRKSPRPSHVLGGLGALIVATQEYQSGKDLSALAISCALIWIALWVNYLRVVKRQSDI
jgi:hypothetical protein